MKTCINCRFWKKEKADHGFAPCVNPRFDGQVIAVVEPCGGAVESWETGKDFGCIFWEEADGSREYELRRFANELEKEKP